MTSLIITEANEFGIADSRNTNHHNCYRCPRLIDYSSYMIDNQIVCKECYEKWVSIENRKDEVGIIDTKFYQEDKL